MALHFASALLPDGWAQNVRVEIAGGRFANAGTRCAAAQTGDERVAVALPGMCNVHSHGFQRGMAGLTEFRGPEADNFWSWRTLMYRFVARMTPEDIGAITAQAYVEMLEGGFTRVGEFHYVHHDPAGKPYVNPAETAIHVASAVARTGIGLTLLPVFYAHGGFDGAKPNDGQRRFVTSLDEFARLMEASRKIVGSLEGANRRRCAAFAARGHPRGTGAGRCRSRARARSTFTPPSKPERWSSAWRGRARGPCNGCSITRRSTADGAWCIRRT